MSKVVFITGCSSGIGKALVKEFADNGFRVIATARNLNKLGFSKIDNISSYKLDITDYPEVEHVLKLVFDEHKNIDILINNAGYGLMAPSIDVSVKEISKQFSTNVYAPLNLIKSIVPNMKLNGGGTIINIGSISGIVTTPFSGAYCASKAALHSFSDALRMELKPFNINVITVKPGAIKSNFGENAQNKAKEVFSKNSLYKSLDSYILQRANGSQIVATPSEVFAKKIVKLMLMGKYPTSVRIGKKSFSLPFLKYILPTKVFDNILIKKFGLNKKL